MHDVTLRTCPLGADVEICRLEFAGRSQFRLGELGFRVHESVRVIQKSMFGGCIVAHGSERIAVGGDTARHIFVKTR